jgi:predicted Zn-dependent protease
MIKVLGRGVQLQFMTEHHNEIHGRDITAPVVQSGRIDRLEINVGDVPPEVGHPPLTSWDDRPDLTPALTDLLMAQREATESLPYTLLGVRKPDFLNEVYVQQSLRPEAPADRAVERDRRTSVEQPMPEQADAGKRPVSVTEALNHGRHLIITGDPGAGKSTLGYMYVQRLSAYWLGAGPERPPLAEPLMPLRIPARALAGKQSWDRLLAEGLSEALARLVTTQLRPDALGKRALGARWLVFIDGLDEITDTSIQRQVIKAIGYQMRRTPDHQLVVTTRPRLDQDITSLCPDQADLFRIQPFGQVELEEFARAWFRAQDAITAPERAADFLQQVRDNRIRGLVGNPLLATIAAITLTMRPDRPLPNNLVDLYEGFMNHLLTDTASGRTTISGLRRSLLDQPLRLHVFDWVARHRDAVITHLAIHRLESEGSLYEAAADYVAGHQDVVDSAELSEGWREDLRAVLDGCGVFGRAGEDLSFWHQSFAEYLAARDRAGQIPAGFPDLDAWIDRGLDEATRRFALFTIVLWSRREGHEIALVLDRLLRGQGTNVLLAAHLIAEGVEVAEDQTAQVMDRIVDLIASSSVPETRLTSASAINEVMASLDHHTVGAPTIDRLRLLRDQPEVAAIARIDCATALGHLTGSEEALRWLENFATEVHPKTVHHIVDVMPGLAQDGVDRAERLLVRLGSAADADYVVVLVTAAMLVQLDRASRAVPLVRDLIRRLRQDPGITPGTLVMPNRSPDAGPLRIRDAWQQPAPTWGEVAELAANAGCPDEALWSARRSLTSPQTTEAELSDAVTAMLTAVGADVVDEVTAAAESRPPAHVLEIASALDNADFADAAGGLARRVLANRQATADQIETAARIVLAAPDGSADEVLALVQKRGQLRTEHQMSLATALTDAGAPAEARRVTRLLLDNPAIEPLDFWGIASLRLDAGGSAAAEDVFQAAVSHSPEHCAQAAPLLAEAGREDLARELMRQVFALPAEFDILTEMADSFRIDGNRELVAATAEVALPLASQADPADIPKLVRVLAAVGRTDEAIALARSAFVRVVAADQNPWQITVDWLGTGGARSAPDIVAEVATSDIKAEWRVQIAQELAEAGLLKAAAAVWLNVVQWHGDTVEQGIDAASRLVACGYRDRVIETITEALADERLLPAARAGLRALMAWVVFSSPDATAEELRPLVDRYS